MIPYHRHYSKQFVTCLSTLIGEINCFLQQSQVLCDSSILPELVSGAVEPSTQPPESSNAVADSLLIVNDADPPEHLEQEK